MGTVLSLPCSMRAAINPHLSTLNELLGACFFKKLTYYTSLGEASGTMTPKKKQRADFGAVNF